MRQLAFLSVSLLFLMLPSSGFAQKNKKERRKNKRNDLVIKDFVPTDSTSVLKLPDISFPNINKIEYYYRPDKLTKIDRFRVNKQPEQYFKELFDYVSQFGIRNFVENMDLMFQLARAAEEQGQIKLTKDLYRLIIKHYRGDLQDAIIYYDSLTLFEKDLYVELEYYYKLVERRKAIDTLKPPEDILLKMDDNVNSPLEDYGMAIGGRNDNIIYFTSQRIPEGFSPDALDFGLSADPSNEDIYYSEKDADGYWGAAQPFEGINTQFNEGSPCLGKDGKMIIFSRCFSPGSLGNCDLFISYKKDDGTWEEAVNLGAEVNSYAWDSHPSLSISEDTLFFASDRRGGFGSSDIYFAVKQEDGSFGDVQNMGPVINTRDSEVSPFYHPNFNVLYFSSNGQLLNFGNLDDEATMVMENGKPRLTFDIFKSFMVSDKWVEPKNVGPLVNGKGDEFYFSTDTQSQWLFYAKSEADNIDNLDLHSFPVPMEARPNNVVKFSGLVVEPATGEVFKGIVSIIDLAEGIEVAPKYLREDGSFEFELINERKYLLIVEGDNFFKIEEMFYVNGDSEINIPATSLNSALTFKAIDFASGSSTLEPEMENNLHLLIEFLQDRPNFDLSIVGHTDSDGDPDFNRKLSLERAKRIKEYIIAYGRIDAGRVKAIGAGSDDPVVAVERNEDDKRINRRVEFKLYIRDEYDQPSKEKDADPNSSNGF